MPTASSTDMNITANGQTFEIEEGASIAQFLESIGKKPGLVIVELNKEALSPSEADSTVLNEGDRLEVVQIVAGG